MHDPKLDALINKGAAEVNPAQRKATYDQTAEYIAKKMWGKPAEFAGDDQLPTQSFRDDVRKFGLIYLEGARGRVEPEAQRAKDAMVRAFSKYGMSFAEQVGYIYDPGRNQADVTNLIATMRSAGVTTIVPLWDPLYPILITQEATHTKKVIFHPLMMPKITICDPELTVGMPPHITAGTGLDALAHCIEAYCAPGYHPMADGIAVEGIDDVTCLGKMLLHEAHADAPRSASRALVSCSPSCEPIS